ncbi:class I SAM-dependent methyltransferase [Myxococcota bacterium]|nr:class I SAM-dependent methyltransferase [Myxococcota bacterium]
MLDRHDRTAALRVARVALASAVVETTALRLGSAARLLLAPLGYWRAPVAGPLLRHLPSRGRVLDLGSPKVLAFTVAASTDLDVVATDLGDSRGLERWRGRYRRAYPRRGNLALAPADGRCLPFPDASFHLAFSVSVLEHVPGDGDTRALAELHRVLVPGGVAVIEVPFGPRYQEVRRRGHRMNELGRDRPEEPTFQERRYDPEALGARLLGAAPFEELERRYVGEAVRGLRPWEDWPPALAATPRALDLPLAVANLGPAPPERARSAILVLRKRGPAA